MSQKAPGKSFRKGMTLMDLLKMFPDDATAERWFVETRWSGDPACPHCGSTNVLSGAKHKTMPYRCREKECRKRFSVRTGTVMESSNLPFQTWAIAMFLVTTSLKSVSSMKLHRDLGITQKSAWHLAHRLRRAWDEDRNWKFSGPVETDEAYFGGLRRNMSNTKRRELSEAGPKRGPSDKTLVAGIKDRETNQVSARVLPSASRANLHGFVADHAEPEATVYTDEAPVYETLPFHHESVKHSVREFVRGMAHTNGIESFWSMLKRAHMGTFHKLSPKHLDRYVQEFAGRHNVRPLDTEHQLINLMLCMDGKRLRYEDLIAPNGLESGARSA